MTLIDEIAELKEKEQAVILAHNYEPGPVQDLADFVGDSLALARWAATTPARILVMAGVYFMAETASILCPDKTVLIPDPEAGCSLADTITPEELMTWKANPLRLIEQPHQAGRTNPAFKFIDGCPHITAAFTGPWRTSPGVWHESMAPDPFAAH
ncbi:quinolinate synthase NadA [Sulfobacillus thermotolerans]|uniref:quinolinate synthase NadA n=1 Tax=Sulfobacillus thermotolerans TaxID=338644 RepID=UPI003369AA9B